jgi:hypothetical protein
MADTKVREWQQHYEEAMELQAEWYQEAYKDLRCHLGDQWDHDDLAYLKDEGRHAFVYNKTRRNVKLVTGYQRKNRLSFYCRPQEGDDEYTSELMSDVMIWAANKDNMYNKISTAFEGCAITGLNMASLWMDPSEDPVNRDIRLAIDPFNSFVMDPYWSKMDLSDCRYIMRRRYINQDEAIALVPTERKDILGMSPMPPDGKFIYMPYSRKGVAGDLYTYDEYWTRKMKRVKMLIDNATGEFRLWKGSDSALGQFLRKYPQVEMIETYQKSVELNIIINGQLVWTGPGPEGLKDYPFVPIVAFHHPEFDDYALRLQGIVRPMRDPQKELNIRRSSMADIWSSNVNSGWIFKEGAVKNPLDLYKTGQGVLIQLDRNSQPGDLERVKPGEIPQSFMAYSEVIDSDINTIPGINEELLGVADGGNSEISGVLAKVRSANGLTILQDLFDNLSLSQKMIGQKMLELIQANFSREKIQRITNKEVPEEIFEEGYSKFDCVVGEGMLTDTQRSLYYAQLVQAVNSGINIPQSAIIDALPISNKSELMKKFEEEEQQKQEQKKVIDEQQEMNLKLANAKIVSDLSLAKEREARIISDISLAQERSSEASENIAQAALAKAKTISEISQMEDDRILKVLSFVNMLENQEAADRENVTSGILQSSQSISQGVEQSFQQKSQEDKPQEQPQNPQQ